MIKDPRSDEDVLAGHLMDIRSEARMHESLSKSPDVTADTRAIRQALAESLWKTARALHRLLLNAGVKGIGPLDY